ncbi:Pre protein translocase subunit Sec66-domain-containing protein [Radiomyces spectabilis]|uniref:Pre protein translocase subunit Sec66-domain-containing protein n=1 Tax=Radiomyces spectabilis TaxID=64574 RepID=UPI00221E633C|nr:Pre protein translocase subunit Sec66-domain-containing protein [Radiomyces spectabilis]KAI8374458.1 Pre protein translocase subunit Sec66-domain-containing protein [Radiomyces spectabilis]
MHSLLLPTLYLGGCITAMSAFSYVYRRVAGFQPVEPWFPVNTQKQEYIALLNCEIPVPEHHLRASLLRRAMEGVRRLVTIQQEKPALQQLMKTGSVGDDLWRDFIVAEQEIMTELQEISQEAETYKEGWGQTIFSTAAQMLEHEKQKALLVEMKQMREDEKNRLLIQEKRDERESRLMEGNRMREAQKMEDLLRTAEAENIENKAP